MRVAPTVAAAGRAPLDRAVAAMRTSPRLRRVRHPRPGWLTGRVRAVSQWEGADRGTPIAVHYARRFLEEHRPDIRGTVLDLGATAMGVPLGPGLGRVDRLCANPWDPAATILADLGSAGALPMEEYDTVLAPLAWRGVADIDAAATNLWWAMRPGATALVCVATVARTGRSTVEDRWRLTPGGLADLFLRNCPGAAVEQLGYGGLVASIGALVGLGAEELDPGDLADDDPRAPVLAAAVVRAGA